jgi:hypothetical protein
MVDVATASQGISAASLEQLKDFDLGVESAQSKPISVENFQAYILESIKTIFITEQYEVIKFSFT